MGEEHQLENQINLHEYNRMWRVVDTSLSAHSLLRDRYHRRYRVTTLLVVVLSIAATGFAFLAGEKKVQLPWVEVELATLLGLLTMLIFFLALLELVVDWRGRAFMHDDAANRLARLKARMRAVTTSDTGVDLDEIDLRSEYEQTMTTIVEIPEGQFLPMKAKHHRKVLVSRLIDSHHGAPLFYVRVLAILQGLSANRHSAEKRQGVEDESVEEPPIP